MTGVVRIALGELRDRLEQRKGGASVDELLAIADRAARRLEQPYPDHADFLYDENGLPK